MPKAPKVNARGEDPHNTKRCFKICVAPNNGRSNVRKKERKKSLTREHVKDIGSAEGIQSYRVEQRYTFLQATM